MAKAVKDQGRPTGALRQLQQAVVKTLDVRAPVPPGTLGREMLRRPPGRGRRLTITQAAKDTGVSRQAIHLAIQQGRLKGHRHLGHWSVAIEALRLYMHLWPKRLRGKRTNSNG